MQKFSGIVFLALLTALNFNFKKCGGGNLPNSTPPPPQPGFNVFTTYTDYTQLQPLPLPDVNISGQVTSELNNTTGNVVEFGPSNTEGYALVVVSGGVTPAYWTFWFDSGSCEGLAATVPSLVVENENFTLNCDLGDSTTSAFGITPWEINTYSPPADWTVTGAGISSQYGMPELEYLNGNGAVVATTTATSVEPDGDSMSGATPGLSGVGNGPFAGLVLNAGPNGTHNVIGVVVQQLNTPPPPSFNGEASLGNGQTLEWYYTETTGTCYEGSYTDWQFSNFTYVDANGYQYPMNGDAAYISSSVQQECPPTGPEPASLPLGYTGANHNIMISFTAEYGGAGSATITQQ